MGRVDEATVRRTPFGEAAVKALEGALTAAKRGDPMAPVTVVPPSQVAGLHVRRKLCSEKGILNVRFMPFGRLAELLAGARLAEKGARRAGPLHQLEAARVALAATPGPFQEFADSPETIRAVAASVAGLERPDRDALAGSGTERARAVVELWDAWHEHLGQYLTTDEMAQAAGEAVSEDCPALKDIGSVVLFLPKKLSLGQRALCEALREKGLLLEVLGEAQEPGAEGKRLIVAGDREEECRAVVREIAGLMESGTPLYRIGVLFATSDPYTALMEEQLDAAGMPHNGAESRRLTHTGPGRCLRLFLESAGGKLDRVGVMTLLSAGSTVPPETVSAWEVLARDADIVRGLPVWESRLGALHRDDADALAAVVRFLGEHGSRECATWAEASTWLAGALVRFRGTAAEDPEAVARAAVDELVARLADLDAFGGKPSRAALNLAVERSLSVPAGAAGHYGDGVFLGRPDAARGLDFDAVFLLGMTDGVFPTPQRDDPIVPRSERLLAGLPAEALGKAREDEREAFLVALASAPSAWLGVPKVDRRAGREVMPATWLLELVGLVAGMAAYSTNYRELALEAGMLATPPSYETALRECPAGSAQERDLQELLAAKDAERDLSALAEGWGEPGLAAGFRAAASRGLSEMTAFDGRVQPVDGVTLPAVHSPSGLEQYAKCPNAYFLGSALKVRETRDFRDGVRLEPRKLGEAVHKALARYFSERREQAPDPERLQALLGEEYDRACGGEQGLGYYGFAMERDMVGQRLAGVLALDAAYREGLGARFDAMEVDFGMDGDVVFPLGREREPTQVALRGRIDRIDVTPTEAIAIDYKTGSVESPGQDPLRKGRRLQGPIYAWYLSQNRPGLEPRFIYVPATKAEDKPYLLEKPDFGDLQRAVAAIVTTMGGGWFPAVSKQGCRFCSFASACPTDHKARWTRKRRQDALYDFRILVGDLEPTGIEAVEREEEDEL